MKTMMNCERFLQYLRRSMHRLKTMEAASFFEMLRFFLAGSFNTLLTFSIYFILVKLGVLYTMANALAWGLSIFSSYFFNASFVFNRNHYKKRISIKNFMAYSAVYVLNFMISLMALIFLIEIKGYDSINAQYLVTPLIAFLNYGLSKLLVFG